jgi:DNA primase catalytic subunit
LTGSNTIHHSAPGLGGDLLAAMAQLIERATAIGGSCDQDGLARAGVRVKNDLLGSDLGFQESKCVFN